MAISVCPRSNGSVTRMAKASILSVLRERAGLQPNDAAFTFTDYEQDRAGIVTSLTWAELYRQTLNVATEVSRHGSVGDRAVILIPQSLDYIVAFLGAMQAGYIAVPLSVPQIGSHDERVGAVLADTTPSVVLTAAGVMPGVTEHVGSSGIEAPALIAVDELDLNARNGSGPRVKDAPDLAYLQYTSGSTRLPAGVMISHQNLIVNYQQLIARIFGHLGGIAPSDTSIVSWLPFYHDMGLILGICAPILGGFYSDLTSPASFLMNPARWVQAIARNPSSVSAAPNFAFELAVRRTTDEDMAGLDLGNVQYILSGAERVHPATLDRFTERFAKFNFRRDMIRPSYGLAEAVVYAATRQSDKQIEVVDFESDDLGEGIARRCAAGTGTPLISYGTPGSPTVRIADPDTGTECPEGTVGEIWINGENVSDGYWQKPEQTERTFGGKLISEVPGTPDGTWLRTGDLGFYSDGELFIVGRIKDLLIVRGRNHYPEDIEATVQELTGGRVAAISVRDDHTETLVTIIEYKKRGDSEEDVARIDAVKGDVTSAISTSHGLNVADLVLVAPGSLPTTTSGKVRRATCVQLYRDGQFTRIDA
jgi:fatty acid CoA ligase FadD21